MIGAADALVVEVVDRVNRARAELIDPAQPGVQVDRQERGAGLIEFAIGSSSCPRTSR